MYVYISGWWFGTMEFYDFPYIGKFIIPTDELIFFGVVETTNQPIVLEVLRVKVTHCPDLPGSTRASTGTTTGTIAGCDLVK
jgi:hypothetical protein